MFLFVMYSREKSIKNFTLFYQAFSEIIDFSRTLHYTTLIQYTKYPDIQI